MRVGKLGLAIGGSDSNGGSKNGRKARKWFHLAAKQGDDQAQYVLGALDQLGQGVPQNDREAAK